MTTRVPEAEESAPTRAAAAGTATRARWFVPVLVGLGASVLGFLGSWVPSGWGDEAATLSAATRSWAGLGRFLENMDAVHGVYYGVLHLWLDVWGPSLLAARALSALGVGVMAAGVVVLGRALGGPRLGLLAGVVVAVLPRTTWLATEARSGALVAAVAVWATVLLVTALRRRSWGWWAGYAVLVGFGVSLWVFLGLLVVAHGVTVLLARPGRRALTGFVVAAAGGGVLAAPVLLRSAAQSGQVSWIPGLGLRTVRGVVVDQAFGTDGLLSLPLAVVCWAAVAWVLVRAVRAGRGAPGLSTVVVALPWLVLPTLGVLAYSLVSSPMYTPKYLAFSVPALALLVGEALTSLRTRAQVVGALVLVALLAVPSYVTERRTAGKDTSDWAPAVRFLAGSARDGDAVVFTEMLGVSSSARAIAVTYPAAFAGLDDPTRLQTAEAQGELWDGSSTVEDARDALLTAPRVWLVADRALAEDGPERAALDDLGFAVADEWQGAHTAVVLLERAG
ncbi:glycosyltransferase family 39 protein [Cellulomonas cellasea]|uniref:Mannosyltransferase n=1 Tax=Cellulomonas cellasea TaxID=43670 RepID=A0A7W4UGW0_9CELL|nr:glycosyltransferase family 39 protein [Cellulomonas cellasea]MBB2923955.1 mannosyltransferase [Cellulomonas cellasea]